MPMPMMQMFFHFRLNEFLLFHDWLTQSFSGYFLSLFAVVIISAFYEAIRVGRAILYRWNEKEECCSGESDALNVAVPPPHPPAGNHQQQVSSSSSSPPSPPFGPSECPGGCPPPSPRLFYRAPISFSSSSHIFSPFHLLQSVLHFLQFLLGFCLMLLAMTYNIPIFIAILAGHTIGYFLAGPLYQHGLAEQGRIGGECCCS